jgi:SagB-type dehydrogenase family enzyme
MKVYRMPKPIVQFLAVLVQITAVGAGATSLNEVKLPDPKTKGEISVEQALLERRSVRDYGEGALTLAQAAQLLWAAQGITSREGLAGIEQGVYRYDPNAHMLHQVTEKDRRAELAGAALGQSCIEESAAVLVFTAVYERTTRKYGQRGIRYVHMEAGHAAQNVFLQATALGLAAVVVGAFDDRAVLTVLQRGADEHPLYLMPVGWK